MQKATEIGIDRIVLLESRRSVVRWSDERAAKSVDRLRRVAAEAAAAEPEGVRAGDREPDPRCRAPRRRGRRTRRTRRATSSAPMTTRWRSDPKEAGLPRSWPPCPTHRGSRRHGAARRDGGARRGHLDGRPPQGGAVSTAAPPFGVYVHIPFCASKCDYCAFATWTDRHHLVTSLPRGAAGGHRRRGRCGSAGGHERLRRRGYADARRGRRSCRRDRVHSRRGRCRGHRRVQPRRRHTSAVRLVPGGGRQPGEHRRPVDGRPRARFARAPARPGNVVAAVDAARTASFPTFNVDVIYGAAGESLADWRRTLEAVMPARAATRLGVRAHRGERHAARRRQLASPR